MSPELEREGNAGENTPPENPKFYNAAASQIIPLTIQKGINKYQVSIELEPLSNEEWFDLMTAVPENAKRVKAVSVDLFAPYAKLGRQKAVARYGYKERSDWREATRDSDFISALKSYLDVSAQLDGIETGDLLDDDEDTPITLVSGIEGINWETTIFFREQKKSEMDEYMAALADQPNKNALASAKKISKERRVYALFEALRTRSENYESDVIPAWHAVEAVSSFLNLQMIRMGKL